MFRSAESASSLSPVTADDLDLAVQLAVGVLRKAPPAAWDGKAGSLEWDCWETVEHLSDDLFAYAVQLGPRKPPLDGEVPFVWESRRPGGPANAVHADRAAGPAGLLQVLEASGALLVAMVRTTPPQARAHHVFGISDPEGFAAMGIVETLVHTHDLAQGLGLVWSPPADLCSRVLARLFPDAPGSTDPWHTLLWATGRAELPGHARLTTWRWDGRPRMTETFMEIKHTDEYAAAFGEPWPGRGGLETVSAAYPSIVVDGWNQEGWVYFLPGGQDGPLDAVGRIVVVGASGSLPVRVCRDGVTRAEWNVIQEPIKYGQEMDFDEFMRLVHGA